jgi:hypothetical protein
MAELGEAGGGIAYPAVSVAIKRFEKPPWRREDQKGQVNSAAAVVVESRGQHASQLLTAYPGWPHSDI